MSLASKPKFSKTLILGGARSGKSRYAEEMAREANKNLIYIATATIYDDEMQKRVTQHKEDRSSHQWTTIEEPLALASVLKENASPDSIILVDCLTLWLNNLLASNDSDRLQKELNELLACLDSLQGEVIFVSNEVGMGIIPLGELTRQFVDEAGRLHQQLGQVVDTVILMVAGLPLFIKPQK